MYCQYYETSQPTITTVKSPVYKISKVQGNKFI